MVDEEGTHMDEDAAVDADQRIVNGASWISKALPPFPRPKSF